MTKWRYSEYKLSPEDLKAMRSVKWPPSLKPPPTSPYQRGDGSPTDQFAQRILYTLLFVFLLLFYFEREIDLEDNYLQFGNMLRFIPHEKF